VISGEIKIAGGKGTVIRRDSAAPVFRLFDVAAGGTLRLTDVTLRGGETLGFGGGVQVAGAFHASNVRFTKNNAGNGGGLSVASGASAGVVDSVFRENTTSAVGGGAIINLGQLRLRNSVLAENTAPINGGGINTQSSGVTKLVDSEVKLNTSGGLGGGLSNLGATIIRRSKVVRNTGSGGGGIATASSQVKIRDSEIKRNVPDNCSPPNTIQRCKN
jgi:hypothetical protein